MTTQFQRRNFRNVSALIDTLVESNFQPVSAAKASPSAADSTTGPSSTAGETLPTEPRIGPEDFYTPADRKRDRRMWDHYDFRSEP